MWAICHIFVLAALRGGAFCSAAATMTSTIARFDAQGYSSILGGSTQTSPQDFEKISRVISGPSPMGDFTEYAYLRHPRVSSLSHSDAPPHIPVEDAGASPHTIVHIDADSLAKGQLMPLDLLRGIKRLVAGLLLFVVAVSILVCSNTSLHVWLLWLTMF
ncbi:hypothetical protein cyc_04919 [Cyclospora cayetanensis]|uniref:Uncharacterized protein n=1 Tax=Cyclospora cayetanensis TaxID=88456 RepID=A0A1D3D4E9_9EIME|nr:hypothetical protein cyc_04919 [Cyclospora cayetanensis]